MGFSSGRSVRTTAYGRGPKETRGLRASGPSSTPSIRTFGLSSRKDRGGGYSSRTGADRFENRSNESTGRFRFSCPLPAGGGGGLVSGGETRCPLATSKTTRPPGLRVGRGVFVPGGVPTTSSVVAVPRFTESLGSDSVPSLFLVHLHAKPLRRRVRQSSEAGEDICRTVVPVTGVRCPTQVGRSVRSGRSANWDCLVGWALLGRMVLVIGRSGIGRLNRYWSVDWYRFVGRPGGHRKSGSRPGLPNLCPAPSTDRQVLCQCPGAFETG